MCELSLKNSVECYLPTACTPVLIPRSLSLPYPPPRTRRACGIGTAAAMLLLCAAVLANLRGLRTQLVAGALRQGDAAQAAASQLIDTALGEQGGSVAAAAAAHQAQQVGGGGHAKRMQEVLRAEEAAHAVLDEASGPRVPNSIDT